MRHDPIEEKKMSKQFQAYWLTLPRSSEATNLISCQNDVWFVTVCNISLSSVWFYCWFFTRALSLSSSSCLFYRWIAFASFAIHTCVTSLQKCSLYLFFFLFFRAYQRCHGKTFLSMRQNNIMIYDFNKFYSIFILRFIVDVCRMVIQHSKWFWCEIEKERIMLSFFALCHNQFYWIHVGRATSIGLKKN